MSGKGKGGFPIRLRCGVIFTSRFINHLREFFEEGAKDNSGKVPVIVYVKFGEGKREGEEWWSLRWERADAYGNGGIFEEAGVPIGLSRQTQKGLGMKYVDFAGGRIIVA